VHSALIDSQCKPICDQIDGIDAERCGSFASKGLPVVVRLPATAHEFEPMPASFTPNDAGSDAMRLAMSVNVRLLLSLPAVS
jgi:hypothetical protein